MMAPMSNGDLGHHPEKMLPPPEAPDIQVDQEFIVNETNRTQYFAENQFGSPDSTDHNISLIIKPMLRTFSIIFHWTCSLEC